MAVVVLRNYMEDNKFAIEFFGDVTPITRALQLVTGAVISCSIFLLLLTGMNAPVYAASCCGGGSSSSLILPKFSNAMMDVSFDMESYNGFYKSDGEWTKDPQGSDLNQYRLNFGYAHRLAPRWQISGSMPYIWNRNQYANLERNTDGFGDSTVSLWYESFDNIACVWAVNTWRDLLPAVYWGAALTVPTGTSPYDSVDDNFEITGRGVYRVDASVVVDKTVYPWSAAFSASYGKHLKRPVNREYGNYIEPYDLELGDRWNTSLSFGYTYFTDTMESLTGTLAYSILKEDKSRIDGVTNPNSGMEKRSMAFTFAWATEEKDWVAKLTWSRAPARDDWGKNFPATDILTLGISHVLQ